MAQYHFNNNGKTGSDDYQSAEYGIRIGRTWDNPATEQKEFVSLPGVVWLDNMKENRVSGDGDFQEILRNGNDMLKQLKQLAETLAPGEAKALALEVVLFRRKEQTNNHKEIMWKLTD